MGLSWKDWNRSDIIYGIVVPLVVVLLIVGLSQLGSFFRSGSFGIVTGIINEIEEMVVIVGVPLSLGLAWNSWTRGASGFLLNVLVCFVGFKFAY